METIKQILKDTNKKTFLDIGTGAGNFIHLIKSIYDDFDKFVGIDLFPNAIEAANKHNEDERVTFEIMDANNMSFDDNSFDVVCLSNSLHHLEDIPKMLTEMRRVVKEDGFIVINEMIADQNDSKQESHKLLHHLSAEIDRIHGDTHYETFTERELLAQLENDTKLKINKRWHLNVPRREANTTEEMDYILNVLDRIGSKIPENDKTDLQKKKEKIKKYIEDNGYDGCTSLMAILQK
ncbi:putative methyltransferase YcgJ [Candidatus Izimaplasma bacterium HR1]|jgi:ubiquinone/menaquinone biosynthesis C-methylase UbiE|uniref:class I SAM-dependent methyltransferase n=1 Tax=Candidatus Izimoplasma sp. HR1 TaxID=1541959 RepID=UPI0004F84A61|nr:putative methyltransferase YcgJ [Candidatus Izimaplasma bacterium HR1]